MFTGIVDAIGEVTEIHKGESSLSIQVKARFRTLQLGDSVAVNGVCLTIEKVFKSTQVQFFISHETLNRTYFSKLKLGSKVNLEYALTPYSVGFASQFVACTADVVASRLDPLASLPLAKASGGPLAKASGGPLAKASGGCSTRFRSRRASSGKSSGKKNISGHFVQGHVDGCGKIFALNKQGKAYELILEIPKIILKYFVPKGSLAVDGISLTINQIKKSRVFFVIVPHTYNHTALYFKKPGESVHLEIDMIAKYVYEYCKRHRSLKKR